MLTLGAARLTGGGADLSASGRIPLAGPGLDVRANGTLPLSLANPFLAERSAQVAGILRVNASAHGRARRAAASAARCRSPAARSSIPTSTSA